MPYQTLVVESRPPLALLTLCQAATGNRVSLLLLTELQQALDELEENPETRGAILVGADGVFSLGWDHATLQEIREAGPSGLRSGLLGSTFQFVADSPLPIIAALNGDALSAGFELALACDVRLAALTAHVGFPETAGGMLPMAGGTQRLARIAGRAVALEMILTAEPVDAATALERRLVSTVAESGDVLDLALSLGATIASRGPLATRLAKEAVHRGVEMPLDQALKFETDLTILLQTTSDRAEGVRAFEQKREPHFRGR